MDKLREIQVQELFGVARGSHKNFILINHIWAELGVDFKNIIVIEAIYDIHRSYDIIRNWGTIFKWILVLLDSLYHQHITCLTTISMNSCCLSTC